MGYTVNLTESIEHLLETHFPGFRATDNYPTVRARPRGTLKPRDWSLAARVVYPKGVEWAIKTFKPYKSPGPDGIYPVCLQEGLSLLLGPLVKVLRASIALRHVPLAWSGTRVTFIPKPGRNGHILAKDFRPISLTSFVLKTLERLIDSFIRTNSLTIRPLASSQYAYRAGRSTDTALHHLVSRIETQLGAGGYALGLFLDIEGAFDATSYTAIKEAMHNHDIAETLVDWTQNMLSDRILTVSYGDITMNGFPARGCPQGGVLSPLLWCLVVDDLLVKLQEAGFLVCGYADDVAVMARGSFLSTLKELMDKALKIIQNWCQAKGLTVNPSKTEAMIFTRKYKPEPIGPLKLWGKELTYSSSVKYLGVYLDPKLDWKPHLEAKRNRFYTSMWACRRAIGRSWGLRPSVALWIYKAILLPRLTYAAVVWWPRVVKVVARNLLKSLQGSYLRAAVGAMRTTPTEALEIALCLPPLDRYIISTAKLTAYRLKCQGEWRGRHLGHTRLAFLQEHPFTLPQDRIPRKYQVFKSFKTQLPSREDWSKPEQICRPNLDIWYTDGSGADGRFGAGVYGSRTNHREFFPLGELATVFQAEVLAILECIKTLTSTDVNNKKILICSDSRAAINALAKTTTESSVVWDCMQALNKLGETNKITIVWVPGHQGIYGNEVADGLAKLGTLEIPAKQVVGVPFATGKNLIKDFLKRDHLISWGQVQGCRQAKLLLGGPLSKRTDELLKMSRRKLSVSIGLLTGHVALRAHLFNLGLAERKDCRLCGSEKEDSIHILCHCPALALRRYRSWGLMFPEPSDLQNVRVGDLYDLFIRAKLDRYP